MLTSYFFRRKQVLCDFRHSRLFPVSNRETYDESHFVYKIRATRVTHTQFKAVELEQKFGNSDSRMLLERHGIRIVSSARAHFLLFSSAPHPPAQLFLQTGQIGALHPSRIAFSVPRP